MYKQCLTAMAIGAVLAAAPALAQTPEEEARVHFEQGIALFEDGKFEQAAIAFERAYEIAPSFKILWNIGQVENELGHFAAAFDAYTRYLAEGEGRIPVSRAAKARKEIKRLEALVGKIRVDSEVGGALIFIDGRKQGATPLDEPVFVDLGEHEVVAKTGGDMIHRELVKVAGGEEVVVEIKAGVSKIEPVGGDEGEEGSEGDSDGPKRVWTWVALGVGGAALAAGGAIGGVVMSKASDLEDDCPDKQCDTEAWKEVGKAENLAMTSNILFGVGAAAVVAGVVLFFVEPGGDDEEDPAVSLAPTIGPQGAGLSLGGRF